jgi:hypothetical protein
LTGSELGFPVLGGLIEERFVSDFIQLLTSQPNENKLEEFPYNNSINIHAWLLIIVSFRWI